LAKQKGGNVVEKEIEIKMADGVCDAVLYEAEDGKKRPGIIHYPDIIGIRPSHRAMAKRLAEAGYTVLLVNPFYRTARGMTFDFTPNFAGDERTMKRFGELIGPLPPEAMEKDAATYINYLATQPSVSAATMGAVGHGGGLFTDKPTSPHLALPRIPKDGPRLYFGHAVNDHAMPQEAIDKFEAALKAWGGRYESELYADAPHGWTVADSPAYRQPQAERAFGKLTALFAGALK
jgi:carboxymethylenebutenolidase